MGKPFKIGDLVRVDDLYGSKSMGVVLETVQHFPHTVQTVGFFDGSTSANHFRTVFCTLIPYEHLDLFTNSIQTKNKEYQDRCNKRFNEWIIEAKKERLKARQMKMF